MRFRTAGDLVLLLAAAAACAGCTDGNAARRGGDGQLVLELGGQHGSLRSALRAAGVEVGPIQRLRGAEPDGAAPAPSPATAAPPPTDGESRGNGDASPTDGARTAPSPTPAAPADAFKTVTLAEGQTLIHLARKHLGDGNRFREILTANGWSEADSRRLRAGQKVKIPRAAAAGGSTAR